MNCAPVDHNGSGSALPTMPQRPGDVYKAEVYSKNNDMVGPCLLKVNKRVVILFKVLLIHRNLHFAICSSRATRFLVLFFPATATTAFILLLHLDRGFLDVIIRISLAC